MGDYEIGSKHKLALLKLAEELGNVSIACQVMGLSRDTFYRYKSAVEDGGVEALLEAGRRKPNPKNRVEPKVETAVTQYAIDFPAHGQVRVSNELRKQGVFASPSGVRSIWLRHGELQIPAQDLGSRGGRRRSDPDGGTGPGAGEEKTR